MKNTLLKFGAITTLSALALVGCSSGDDTTGDDPTTSSTSATSDPTASDPATSEAPGDDEATDDTQAIKDLYNNYVTATFDGSVPVDTDAVPPTEPSEIIASLEAPLQPLLQYYDTEGLSESDQAFLYFYLYGLAAIGQQAQSMDQEQLQQAINENAITDDQIEINGDTATVTAPAQTVGEGQIGLAVPETSVTLNKIDGEWKMDAQKVIDDALEILPFEGVNTSEDYFEFVRSMSEQGMGTAPDPETVP